MSFPSSPVKQIRQLGNISTESETPLQNEKVNSVKLQLHLKATFLSIQHEKRFQLPCMIAFPNVFGASYSPK